MNKKILIVIAAVLAMILLAGMLVLLVMNNSGKEPDTQLPETSATVPDESDAFNEQQIDTVPTTQTGWGELPTVSMQEAIEPETAEKETKPAATEPEATEKETKPAATDPTQKVENPTVPDTTKESTEPTEVTMPELPTEAGTKVPESKDLDYLQYHNMSGAEQAAFINSFDTMEDFYI